MLILVSSFSYLNERIDKLTQQCVKVLVDQGFDKSSIVTTPYLHLRYDRTDCALMCTATPTNNKDKTCRHGDFLASFTTRYQREFGFTIPSRAVIVDDIRVRGTAQACSHSPSPVPADKLPPQPVYVSYIKPVKLV